MTLHVPNLSTEVQTNAKTHFAPQTATSAGLYRNFVKRLIDMFLVLLAAPIVLPLIAVLAVLVAILTGGKPFYSQLRVGKSGQHFRMWKLRTMIKNADAELQGYLEKNPEARREWESTQKLKSDPRITPVGRLLRKSSMDELPQLFNVLNGTMSLVGPRPMMVEQKPYYGGQAYYRLRPGITGLWQVSDRNDCDFGDRVAYDDQYDQILSFKTDMSILLRTVTVVLRATGH